MRVSKSCFNVTSTDSLNLKGTHLAVRRLHPAAERQLLLLVRRTIEGAQCASRTRRTFHTPWTSRRSCLGTGARNGRLEVLRRQRCTDKPDPLAR